MHSEGNNPQRKTRRAGLKDLSFSQFWKVRYLTWRGESLSSIQSVLPWVDPAAIRSGMQAAEETKPTDELVLEVTARLGNGMKAYRVKREMGLSQGQLDWIRERAWELRGVSIRCEDITPLPLDMNQRLRLRFTPDGEV